MLQCKIASSTIERCSYRFPTLVSRPSIMSRATRVTKQFTAPASQNMTPVFAHRTVFQLASARQDHTLTVSSLCGFSCLTEHPLTCLTTTKTPHLNLEKDSTQVRHNRPSPNLIQAIKQRQKKRGRCFFEWSSVFAHENSWSHRWC